DCATDFGGARVIGLFERLGQASSAGGVNLVPNAGAGPAGFDWATDANDLWQAAQSIQGGVGMTGVAADINGSIVEGAQDGAKVIPAIPAYLAQLPWWVDLPDPGPFAFDLAVDDGPGTDSHLVLHLSGHGVYSAVQGPGDEIFGPYLVAQVADQM